MAETVVVVPTYNERENILPLVEAIEASGVDCDILVVDDNSPDGTGKLVDEIGRTHPQVSALHRAGRGVFEKEVRSGDERLQRIASRIAVEIDGRAALAAVESMEAQAGQAVGQGRIERRLEARCASAWRLDLDHLGAEPSQYQRSQPGAAIREIEHAVAAQHSGALLHHGANLSTPVVSAPTTETLRIRAHRVSRHSGPNLRTWYDSVTIARR